MRVVISCLPLMVVAACAPQVSTGNGVDINAAATQAQDTVDAYGANVGSGDDAAIEVPETDAADAADAAAAGNDADEATAQAGAPAPGTPGALADDRTPLPEAALTPDSAQGAANVVQTYYALIGEGRYAQAFALRDAGAAGPRTAAAFAASFARYGAYHATVGAPGLVEGGAGQRLVTVPVQVEARLTAGATPVHESGSVTLHRAGDVDDATAVPAWRIRSIDLHPAPTR